MARAENLTNTYLHFIQPVSHYTVCITLPPKTHTLKTYYLLVTECSSGLMSRCFFSPQYILMETFKCIHFLGFTVFSPHTLRPSSCFLWKMVHIFLESCCLPLDFLVPFFSGYILYVATGIQGYAMVSKHRMS